jgi:hypothetical protein
MRVFTNSVELRSVRWAAWSVMTLQQVRGTTTGTRYYSGEVDPRPSKAAAIGGLTYDGAGRVGSVWHGAAA